MSQDTGMLTEKEKEALRLLLAGHDAKSSARELDISVHTLNDRLRSARRKLGARLASGQRDLGEGASRRSGIRCVVPEGGSLASATSRERVG